MPETLALIRHDCAHVLAEAVQGDRSILAEVHAPGFAEARDELALFAELQKSPEHVHTYRLTPLSLWNAAAAGLTPPPEGWIARMRAVLGMSGAQLGRRLGVSRKRIPQAEKSEVAGGITLRSMKEIAEAMNARSSWVSMKWYAACPNSWTATTAESSSGSA